MDGLDGLGGFLDNLDDLENRADLPSSGGDRRLSG